MPRYSLNGTYDKDTTNTPIAADSAGCAWMASRGWISRIPCSRIIPRPNSWCGWRQEGFTRIARAIFTSINLSKDPPSFHAPTNRLRFPDGNKANGPGMRFLRTIRRGCSEFLAFRRSKFVFHLSE